MGSDGSVFNSFSSYITKCNSITCNSIIKCHQEIRYFIARFFITASLHTGVSQKKKILVKHKNSQKMK